MTRLTDTDKLYAILGKWTPGTWVPHAAILSESFALYDHGMTVHSRVSDLRKQGQHLRNIGRPGYDVQCKVETVDGRRRSYYRLVTP